MDHRARATSAALTETGFSVRFTERLRSALVQGSLRRVAPIGNDTLEELLRLLDKLPFVGGLRRDLATLRQLLYLRRPPRFAVVAERGAADELLDRLIARPASLLAPTTQDWLGVTSEGVQIDWLGVDPSQALPGGALARRRPDLLIVLLEADATLERAREPLERAAQLVDHLRALELDADKEPPAPACVIVVREAVESSVGRLPETSFELRASLLERARKLGLGAAEIHQGSLDDASLALLSDTIVRAIPNEARLEAARALRYATASRRETARMLVQSSSALAMTVALTPIPFSDLGVLVPLQVVTVTGIAYLGGRAWSYRSAAEWLASAGIVGGIGLGFRWTSRQLVKLVPGAGSIISASIAGAGTTALGRSAIAYFLTAD